MQNALENGSGWRSTPWRIAGWSTAAGLMLLPITVRLVSGNFGWSIGDFLGVGFILFTGCLIFDLVARKSPNLSYLAGAGAALAAGFGLFVVNGAVGLVGSGDEAHNAFFFASTLAAMLGAVIAAGRAEGMGRAMFAAAITHIVVSVALLIKARGASDGDPRMEIVGLGVFAALWLASAWLFRRASQEQIGSA